jgi:endonuclease/exonuclease/phosphatase family metal-dependent hydrolase
LRQTHVTRRLTFALLVPLLVLAAAAVPDDRAAAPGSPPGLSVDLRVMSFNIAHGWGDLDRTAEVIADSGAEVIALQEVDVAWGERSDFADQAQELADTLDMHVFFAPIYTYEPVDEGLPPQQYGLAMLSEYPIVDATNHEIARLSTQDEDPQPEPMPGFPHVTVNVRGVEVDVYNTHLDFRGDPFVREEQVADMLEVIGDDPGPAVLMGDLNAPPGAPELGPLFEVFDDAWQLAGDGDGFTFPAPDADARIDYVLTSPDLDVTAASVIETDASDHRPVVADVLMARETGRS